MKKFFLFMVLGFCSAVHATKIIVNNRTNYPAKFLVKYTGICKSSEHKIDAGVIGGEFTTSKYGPFKSDCCIKEIYQWRHCTPERAKERAAASKTCYMTELGEPFEDMDKNWGLIATGDQLKKLGKVKGVGDNCNGYFELDVIDELDVENNYLR